MTIHGDTTLHDALVGELGEGAWTAAVLGPDGTIIAGRDIGPDDDVEIGSISKGITALLYVDALDRGEVAPDDTLGSHLDLEGSPVAELPLAAVSTHRSGLPSLQSGAHTTRRTVSCLLRQTNPYGDTLEELLVQVRGTRLKAARPRYSNIGFQLLGHAVAGAAGTSYAELVRARVAVPLRLHSLTVPASRAELGPRAVVGRTRRGKVADPWTGEALGPAGGIRLSVTDSARLARALLDGTAPGICALDPVADVMGSKMRIGAAWITSPGPDGPVTWDNGGTGGFRTWLGLDRSTGRRPWSSTLAPSRPTRSDSGFSPVCRHPPECRRDGAGHPHGMTGATRAQRLLRRP